MMRGSEGMMVDESAVLRLRVLIGVFLLTVCTVYAQHSEIQSYNEYKGEVVDVNTHNPISGVHVTVKDKQISTLTNTEGLFLLKVPKTLKKAVISFSKIGYERFNINLPAIGQEPIKIYLSPSETQLKEVVVYPEKDPQRLVEIALSKQRPGNHFLTGFYREQISRGNRNVMLSEAVVQVNENKWISGDRGVLSLYKSRKWTDYKRLDTLAVKLRGGPYTTLYMDLIAYPKYVFGRDNLRYFNFSFKPSTKIDKRYVYVIYFEQKSKDLPWYHGQLFIDAQTNALIKADYTLNLDNREAARRMLVVQKPRHAIVTPLEAHYQVTYTQKGGYWLFSYSRFFIKLRVNWKGRLFNGRYSIKSEMVITDRNVIPVYQNKHLTKIKPSIIMSDNSAGFGDQNFWGPNNIIKPTESLQEAIDEIRERINVYNSVK